MAIKYSESAVSLLILLPGVLLGIVMLLLTVEHSNDRKENVRDIISNFTKTYCTPVKITSISLIQYLPDELAMFTDAMDFMAKDISDKIGEMEHVIDSTTGMLADLDAKNGVANMRAEELLERYNKSGIDSLFNKFSDSRKAISAPKVGEYVQFQEILKVPVNGNETPKSLDDFWGE